MASRARVEVGSWQRTGGSSGGGPYLRAARVNGDQDGWPFDRAAVRALADLDLTAPITFLTAASRLGRQSRYLLDEPEAALSVTSCLPVRRSGVRRSTRSRSSNPIHARL